MESVINFQGAKIFVKSVSSIGEFGLIDRIKNLVQESKHPDLLQGIGDDTAVIRFSENRALLVTCDIQVENQHFRLKYTTPYQLGRRAMAVNLSDIAAMGGKPTFALVSLGFPKSFPLVQFDELFKGMRDQMADFSGTIIGGNLSHTQDVLIIDITMMGEADSRKILFRSGAQIGDRIFCSGNLGFSGAGFHILSKFDEDFSAKFDKFVQAHLQPIPRIFLGQLIAKSGYGSAMIDISDGIASDLNHICTSSTVGAEIYEARLPGSNQLAEIEKLSGKSWLELVLHSGEDYELLFTMKADTPDDILKTIVQESGVQISEIGKIVSMKSGFYLLNQYNERVPIKPTGWDHFK